MISFEALVEARPLIHRGREITWGISMDLAAFSTLQTDTGVTLAALDWSGGSGHHVSGTLRFPAIAPDARPALEGASRLTLTIRDLDASERVFEWNLPLAQ